MDKTQNDHKYIYFKAQKNSSLKAWYMCFFNCQLFRPISYFVQILDILSVSCFVPLAILFHQLFCLWLFCPLAVLSHQLFCPISYFVFSCFVRQLFCLLAVLSLAVLALAILSVYHFINTVLFIWHVIQKKINCVTSTSNVSDKNKCFSLISVDFN